MPEVHASTRKALAFASTFIRQCYRTKNGKRHAYWALVESHRTATGRGSESLPGWGSLMKPDDLVFSKPVR